MKYSIRADNPIDTTVTYAAGKTREKSEKLLRQYAKYWPDRNWYLVEINENVIVSHEPTKNNPKV